MARRLDLLDKERCVGYQSCMCACARRPGVGGLVGPSIWVRSAGGIRKGFVVIVCRACPDPPCASPGASWRPRRLWARSTGSLYGNLFMPTVRPCNSYHNLGRPCSVKEVMYGQQHFDCDWRSY